MLDDRGQVDRFFLLRLYQRRRADDASVYDTLVPVVPHFERGHVDKRPTFIARFAMTVPLS